MGDPADVRLRRRWGVVRGVVETELAAWCAEAVEEVRGLDPRVVPAAEAVAALTLAPAKRLRPLLVRYGCLLAGGPGVPSSAEVRLAAAVEMLHTFALVQDDVIDGSPRRRGAPSIYARFGTAGALLASDLASVWVDGLLDSAEVPTIVAVRQQVRLLRLETVVGEYLDACVAPSGLDVRHRDVLKTARYTSTRPLLIGAQLGPSPVDPVALQEFGDALGICFQARDDQLDGESALAVDDGAARVALDKLDAPAEVTDELRVLLSWVSDRSA